jgi:hypothetical protein
MDTENLTNEGMKQPTGSLAYELADSLSGEMDELAGENDRLEEEVSEATDRLIDCCSEAVNRFEQIEEYLQYILDDIPDHQEKGTWRDMRDNLKGTLELLNDAVIYFNKMQDF